MGKIHDLMLQDEILFCGIVLLAGLFCGAVTRLVAYLRERRAA